MSVLLSMPTTPSPLLESMNDDCLIGEIRAGLARIALDYVNLAVLVREAQRRGLDLSPFQLPAYNMFILLLRNVLHPLAFAKFQGTKAINSIARMSLERQEQLAQDGTVKVYDPKSDSDIIVPIVELDRAQTELVFTPAGMRTVDQQRAEFRRRLNSESINPDPIEPEITYHATIDCVTFKGHKKKIPVRHIREFLESKLGYKIKKAMTD